MQSSLRNYGQEESRLLNLRRLRSSREWCAHGVCCCRRRGHVLACDSFTPSFPPLSYSTWPTSQNEKGQHASRPSRWHFATGVWELWELALAWLQRNEIIRSEKLQNESVPEFFEFSSQILPRIFEEFSCFVSWDGDQKKFTKNLRHFHQCKIPRQIRREIHKSFLESEQSKKSGLALPWETKDTVVVLRSPAPPVEYQTPLSPKIHPKMHPESSPKTNVRKMYEKCIFFVIFSYVGFGRRCGVNFGSYLGFRGVLYPERREQGLVWQGIVCGGGWVVERWRVPLGQCGRIAQAPPGSSLGQADWGHTHVVDHKPCTWSVLLGEVP